MLNVDHARAVVSSFLDTSDGQALKSRELIHLLLDYTSEPFARRQFTPGHITCTGLVIARGGTDVLLVHHRRLDRWLLPGGHVEPDDQSLWEAARREVLEETGVGLVPELMPRLAGLDVHGIPPKGREPYHLHHDLIFAFRAAEDAIVCSPESRAVIWCAPEAFDRYAVPGPARYAYVRAAGR